MMIGLERQMPVKRLLLIAQSMLLVGLLGLGYGLFEMHKTTRTLAAQIASLYAEQGERPGHVAALKSATPRANTQAAAHPVAESTSLRPLVQRLDAIERELNELRVSTERERAMASLDESVEDTADFPLDQGDEIPVQSAIVTTHQEEIGHSRWGEASSEKILQAFADTPYFADYGGDLAADCRQTTCRLEWTMPRPDGLPRAESEKMLALAKYELFALASENSEQVAQLVTEWVWENGQPKAILYFQKK